MRMIDQQSGQVNLDSIEELQLRSLYSIAGLQFVIPDGVVKGEYQIIKNLEEETNQNSLKLRVSSINDLNLMEFKEIELFGGKGVTDNYERLSLGGLDFSIKYGSLVYKLPFSIQLNDFNAEKYPGTCLLYTSPSPRDRQKSRMPSSA